jgi:hypothetical protein
MARVIILLAAWFLLSPIGAAPLATWGFWSHKLINRMAVYRLPPEMAGFFKKHIDLISENAVNPDRRRYSVVGEAERHFIDLDVYGDSAFFLPRTWEAAIAKFGEDSLRRHGIAPWYLQQHVRKLTEAFRQKDHRRILTLATDLGHYVGDIHVPLHTTRNYNGQLSGQEGIHAFWESRLPELYAEKYDFWIGPAFYVNDMSEAIWQTVFRTNLACDSVLSFEKKVSSSIPPDKRYTHELRNNVLSKMPSREFAEAYHTLLEGQVERQMKAAIQLTGDLWYSCWVDAGQPLLAPIPSNYLDDAPPSDRPLHGIRQEQEGQ